MVQTLSEESFEGYVNEHEIAVIDFTSPTCTPCQTIKPIVEQLATEYDGKAGVAIVDIQQSPSLAVKCGVMSVPTVMYFKHGKPVEQIVGARSKKDYANTLDKVAATP